MNASALSLILTTLGQMNSYKTFINLFSGFINFNIQKHPKSIILIPSGWIPHLLQNLRHGVDNLKILKHEGAYKAPPKQHQLSLHIQVAYNAPIV
jgi:hypothetical protein